MIQYDNLVDFMMANPFALNHLMHILYEDDLVNIVTHNDEVIIDEYPNEFRCIFNQYDITENCIKRMLDFDIDFFTFFADQLSVEAQIRFIQENSDSFFAISKPSEEVCVAFLEYGHHGIGPIKNPSEKLKRIAIKNDPFDIASIKNPSQELKRIAVKTDPYAICNIKNPSKELQLLAVKKDSTSLKFIPEPHEETIENAIKDNFLNLYYLNNIIHHKYQKIAIEKSPYAISWILFLRERLLKINFKSLIIPIKKSLSLHKKLWGDNMPNFMHSPDAKRCHCNHIIFDLIHFPNATTASEPNIENFIF